MGMQTMESHGDDNSSGKQSNKIPRQNSIYNLTLEEVQNQLCDTGKSLSSMNLDELLKSVWTAENNHEMGIDEDGTQIGNQNPLQRQASLSLTGALSKKTVDEVWRDIQQGKSNGERKSRDRQATLGEMTLEDFLVKAGVVAESSGGNSECVHAANVVPLTPQFQPPGPWMQYPVVPYQHQQQPMISVYMPGQQPLHVGTGSFVDASFIESPLPLSSHLVGNLSDSQASSRKRGTPGEAIEKSAERRQKRMIKNRESAARSRARKQAYTNELENKVSRLEEENEKLRKRRELENMLPSTQCPEPRYQLRRTSSAPF